MAAPASDAESSRSTPSTSPSPAALDHPRIEPWKWGVIWLMFAATMLNYMDRQTMASTQVYLRKEFDLDNQGYGRVDFAFSISFAIMQLFAGWMADHFRIRWLFAAAVLVWSAAGLFTGLSHTLIELYACRILLGIGESFNFICAASVVERIIPRASRSLANGIFNGGASVGAAATPILAMFLIGANGENWRSIFLWIGGAGIIWAVVWFWVVRGPRAEVISNAKVHSPLEPRKTEVPFLRVMAMKRFWIVFLYGAAINLTWHFYRLWFSPMFTDERHATSADVQWYLMSFYIAADIGSMVSGWITRKLTTAHRSVVQARRMVMFGSATLCLLSGPFTYVDNLYFALPMVCLVGMGTMGCFASYYAMAQEISSAHTARCLGVIGSLVWFCIAVMQPLVGWIKDQIHTFQPLMIVIGFLPLIGAIIVLNWPEHEEPTVK